MKLKELKEKVFQHFKVDNTKELRKILSRCWTKLNVKKEYPLTKKWIVDLRCKVSWDLILKAVENFGEKFNQIIDAIHSRCNIKGKGRRGRKKKGETEEFPVDPNFVEKHQEKETPPGLIWIAQNHIGYTDIQGEFITGIISENKKGKLEKIQRRLKKLKLNGLMSQEIVPGYQGISPTPKRWELMILASKESLLIQELEKLTQIEPESTNKIPPPVEEKLKVSCLGEYENFTININGVELLTRYSPHYAKSVGHMEFRGMSKEHIPISTSNYRSHFIFKQQLLEVGTPEEYAIAYCYAVIALDDTREPTLEEILEASKNNKIVEFPKNSEQGQDPIAS